MNWNFTGWLKSYLKGRTQTVMANKTSSEPGIVTCRDPQGSILGQLLFLCYINDMIISVTFENFSYLLMIRL